MAQSIWRTIDLTSTEIPEEVLSKREYSTINEEFKDVEGYQVLCREALPEGENFSSNVSLLMLHGQMFSSKTWLDLGTLHLVAAMGYRVIAIDIPGYGKSRHSTISDRGKFVKSLVESFGLSHPVIVSPSLSGLFTLPFLLQHSDMLTGYIPVAPVGIEVLKSLPHSSDDNLMKQVYEPLRQFLHKPLPDLSQIKTPTLVVFGEKDRSESSALLSLLPNSQCQEIPNGRHPAYLDDPDLWHKLIYNFLRHLSENV